MKTFIVFASILTVVLYIAAPLGHAQGKGQGQGRGHAVGQHPRDHIDRDINRPQ